MNVDGLPFTEKLAFVDLSLAVIAKFAASNDQMYFSSCANSERLQATFHRVLVS